MQTSTSSSNITFIDRTHRPFIYIKFRGDIEITDENFEEYKKEYLELLMTCKQNQDKIIPIIDVSAINILSGKYMTKQMEFNKQLFKLHEKYLHFAIIYTESKVLKNLIKINMFVERTAVPVHICRSISKINKIIEQNYGENFDSSVLISKETE